MTIGYVQGQQLLNATAGTSVTSGAFTAISAGDSIVGTVQMTANVNLNSVTDNAGAGNSYVVQQASIEWSTFGVYIALFTGLNLKGGPTTMTFNMSGNAAIGQGGFDEFSNVGSINAVTVFAENDNPNPSSSITASVANCMLWFGAWLNSSSTNPPGWNQGFQNLSVSGQNDLYLLESAAGTYSPAYGGSAAGQNSLGMVALAPILLDSIGNPIFRVRGRRWR